jgi:hypothetical protein
LLPVLSGQDQTLLSAAGLPVADSLACGMTPAIDALLATRSRALGRHRRGCTPAGLDVEPAPRDAGAGCCLAARRPERHAARSKPSTAPGTESTVGLKGLSHEGAAADSDGHRRHPVVEPPMNLETPQERPMKNPLQALASLFTRLRTPTNIEEQYLAQAVDASDFEVRLQVLERARP